MSSFVVLFYAFLFLLCREGCRDQVVTSLSCNFRISFKLNSFCFVAVHKTAKNNVPQKDKSKTERKHANLWETQIVAEYLLVYYLQ